MAWKRWLIVLGLAAVWAAPTAQAGDLKITLPKRSKLTPVQRLNREGVEAIRKNNLEKAKSLFYRAYLFDPDDPFTLNNMGYVSELEGRADQARRFYTQAAQMGTDAVVDKASSPHMEGESFLNALSNAHDLPMEVNRSNVAAVRLLSEGRAPEAELVLRHALSLDQKNPFTLNNLGVAKEAEGNFEEALKYYTAAADLHSDEKVIVSQSGTWRGKPISELAAGTAKRLSQRMQTEGGPEERAGLLNLHAVAALNRNDRQAAGKAFLQAYQLDPNSAFTLNNLGYLAEMDGDLETAQVFYEKARLAQNAKARVGLATRQSAEGLKLFEVADDSDQSVGVKIGELSEARRRQTGPIELKRRDGKPVDEPTQPDTTQPKNDSAIPPK
ncbi:MAG: tetratricopeptide repeat protein [Terriglobales bacterium]